MRPGVQIGILLVVALIVFIILQSSGSGGNNLPPTIGVDEAYSKYQSGAFVLDVRTQEEWNEFHAPNTTLIPLDQLEARLNEVPRDKEIVVVCRSGNRSQQGRDILLKAGFEQVTSMAGGLNEWRTKGYPIEP
jgi:rhodanese-related sulfurtransferase